MSQFLKAGSLICVATKQGNQDESSTRIYKCGRMIRLLQQCNLYEVDHLEKPRRASIEQKLAWSNEAMFTVYTDSVIQSVTSEPEFFVYFIY